MYLRRQSLFSINTRTTLEVKHNNSIHPCKNLPIAFMNGLGQYRLVYSLEAMYFPAHGFGPLTRTTQISLSHRISIRCTAERTGHSFDIIALDTWLSSSPGLRNASMAARFLSRLRVWCL